MGISDTQETLKLAVFAADLWQHVCPVVRLTGPAEFSNVQIIKGNDWQNGELRVSPEVIAESDLVVIQRDFPEHSDAYQQALEQARAQGKPVVYEIDDLLAELPPAHPDYGHYRITRSSIIRGVVEADAVVATTGPLADYLRQFNPNVHVFPNYLNDHIWSLHPRQHTSHSPVVIGYMGGHSHAYDFEIATPALQHILEEYGSRVILRFWGLQPPPILRDFPSVEWLNPLLVDYREFAAYFLQQNCDIFIAPLQDNLFNHCKSHLKFLEYSALGIPAVYSKITPYERLVVDGKSGFLASNKEEWIAALGRLIDDEQLRWEMGAEAQDTVRRNWLLSEHAAEWRAIYANLASLPSGAGANATVHALTKKLHAWEHELEHELAVEIEDKAKTIQECQSQVKNWQDMAHEYERRVIDREQTIEYLGGSYADIMNSRGWKAMQQLFRLRRAVVPLGSRRETLLRLGLDTLSTLRRRGPGAALHTAGSGAKAFMRGQRLAGGAQPGWRQPGRDLPDLSPAILVEPGALCPSPAISVLIIQQADANPLYQTAVSAWITGQTCADLLQGVVWDQALRSAWLLTEPETRWDVADASALLASLPSRYLCVASPDLLAQDKTYLEENLIALETETLAFTINIRGNAPWLLKNIRQGQFPGDSTLPLLRIVAHRDCVDANFQLNLSPWIKERRGLPEVAARVIQHPTNRADKPEDLPCAITLPLHGNQFLLDGKNLLVRTPVPQDWKAPRHVIHPLESVLPPTPHPSGMPTVIMIHTFLAMGGAERIHLLLMRKLLPQVRFVVLGIEPLDAALGTTADEFRQYTPYVYTLPDFLNPRLNFSFMTRLIESFKPEALYIANGATFVYEALPELKKMYPAMRTANQVYDHQVGWITRYDLSTAVSLDAHIAINQKIAQAYRDHGAKEKEIHLIENGIFPEDFDPEKYDADRIQRIKLSLGLPLDKKIVTFAARIHPQKRPLDYVELARRMASDDSIEFLMIGDGPLAEQVNEQIAKADLKNIHRHPFYQPMSDIYAISDVYVLPSDFEGMPMVIIEAQAMGKPVVVTDVGNNKEVLSHTGGGVVIPQIGDIAALMAGVQKMLAEPPNPAQLRRSTLNRFHIAIAAELYRRALLGLKDA